MFRRNKVGLAFSFQLSAFRKRIYAYFALVCLYLIAFASPSYAKDTMPSKLSSKEPIVVNGDTVEYFHEKKQVTGTGNISITYKDVVLTCEKITVYLDTKEAIAEGNVKITQKDAYFTGEKMNYNFETKKGKVLDGFISTTPFYGRAREVDKIAMKDQFNLNTGYVTTCNYEEPHYRLQSKQVRIYPDDKIVAKHIFFYIGNIPVLYFPYYVQPLKEKKSHINVIPGQSKDWGYYALTSYRYHLDDDNCGDILVDYRSKKGLGVGINHYYTTKEVGNGAIKFYYTHENDILAFEKMGATVSRYRWQVRHKWDMGEATDTYAAVEFNKLSDRDIIKDYFYNEYEELGDKPDNYVSFITQKMDYSTEFLLRKRFDKFYDVVERLPEFRIDIPSYRLFQDLPLYYQANASSTYLNHAFDNTNINPPQKDLSVVRIDTYNRLSYATRLFRALSVTPYAGVEETYYSRNKWGDTNLVRGAFSAGVDNSIKFFKIYNVKSNLWGLDINDLRHIITPTAGYYYIHQPTISSSNLNQFDAIDELAAHNGFGLGLENRLQTKRLDGDQMKSVDLATLRISTNYDFTLKDDRWELEGKFDKFYFQLELVPYSWAFLQSRVTVDPKKYVVESESLDLVASGGEAWSLAASHRYENVATGSNNLLTVDGMYRINEKWKVRIYERFNAINGSLEEQEYIVYRDMHCWKAEFICNIKNFKDITFYAIMRLKAFPDYPIGLKRTYSRPRFGNVGDQ